MKMFVTCLCLIGMLQSPGQKAYVTRQQEQRQRVLQYERRDHRWHAATFKGLAVGRATRRDMLRLLGSPAWTELMGKGKHRPERWYHYKSTDLPGALVVIVDRRSGLILRIDLYPEALSKGDATKYFGDDFIVTRYDFDDCLGDEESAPLYESPDGSITNIEYRARGIAIAINYQNRVDHISYVSRPVGASSSKCKGRGKAS